MYGLKTRDKTWRFWELYVHVCKIEALQEAYKMAKNKNGALKLIIEPIFEADFQ
jgi:RNA-directed DNA polymerase